MAAKFVPPKVTKVYAQDDEACTKVLALIGTQVWQPNKDTDEARRNCGLWKGR